MGPVLRVLRATLRRDLQEARTYRTGALSRLLGLFGLLFSVYFVARTFAGHEPPGVAACGGYFVFLLLGLTVTDLTWALIGGASDRVRQGQLAGTVEGELATGVPISTWLAAQGAFAVLAACGRAVLVLGVGFALADTSPPMASVPKLLLAFALTIAAHLPIGRVGGAVTLWLKRADPLGRGLHAASMLLSGVAYPVSVLPTWLQTAAELSPTTHALRALRAALYSSSDGGELTTACAALAGFAVVGHVVAGPLVRHFDQRARRAGSLVQY